MRRIAVLTGVLLAVSASAEDWRSVKIARSADEVAACEFVGQVENRFAGGNRNVAQKRMLRQAANRGATHVLIHPEDGGKEWAKALFIGYSTTGEAYRCQQRAASVTN